MFYILANSSCKLFLMALNNQPNRGKIYDTPLMVCSVDGRIPTLR